MAIDQMKKVTLACPVAASQRLMKELHGLGVVQLTDAFEELEDAKEHLHRQQVSTEESDRHLQKINLILGLLDQFAPVQQGFIAGLAPVPLLIDAKELDETLQNFDLDTVFEEAHELDAVHRRTDRAIGDIQNQLRDLAPYEDLPFKVADLGKTEHTRLVFGAMMAKNLEEMSRDAEACRLLAWGTVVPGQYMRQNGSGGKAPAPSSGTARMRVVFAYLRSDEEEARNILSRYAFEEIALPALPGFVRDHIRELNADLTGLETQAKETAEKARALNVHRHALEILKAFWESRKVLTLARSNAAEGKWSQVLTGYVRQRDLHLLEDLLQRDFPTVSLMVEDPAPGEDVPVSITLPPLVRPVQMLINMYGLPYYGGFDPSPYLMFSFFLFFGMCFGDVGYGLMLLCGSWYIMRRARAYEGIYNFGKLLFMASIPTLFFGFIFGSCFGDLYKAEYMGEGNVLLRIFEKTTIVDPVQNPVVVLMLALAIGVTNQFYAIGLKMYGLIKQGDTASAIFDGLFWLIALPGFILLVGNMFAEVPGWLTTIGWILFGAGALGLVLFQGRAQSNPIARLLTGVVSLYGIVGSYGITSFIGDTMSYCRLLALGLTTAIVAIAFNMIAGMVRDSAGIIPFILLLVFMHIFNFLICVLGAFVHSMRLILVEFFGRFYEGGAKPFTPLAFDSEAAVIRKG